MITEGQMERAEKEFAANARAAFEVAKQAERALENATYYERPHDPAKRAKLLEEFQDADYMAESRAWILHMIRERRKRTEG